jgi:hypothetical protein
MAEPRAPIARPHRDNMSTDYLEFEFLATDANGKPIARVIEIEDYLAKAYAKAWRRIADNKDYPKVFDLRQIVRAPGRSAAA